MTVPRLLVLGLDGYEPSIADDLVAAGRMPHLARLTERSARFALDHGDAKRTGLAWEHVSLGQSPEACGRWAAVGFDPATYEAYKEDTTGTPFLAGTELRAVIFDAPYFDLARAPRCRGLVHWGAHDPGVAAHAVPASLTEEIGARFGPYPASRYIYGFVWPDAERARAMADALTHAVDVRSAISGWLFGERFPDWDLALVVVSEFHSAIEALWHGIDPAHPLHGAASAPAARDGIVGVYEAFDRMLGTLSDRFPDARLVVFSMHGMGANDSDVATMLLLPELLYRAQRGQPFFVPRPEWLAARDGIPPIDAHTDWARAVNACLSGNGATAAPAPLRALRRAWSKITSGDGARPRWDWMPAARYDAVWPELDAFALPSFYDGRVRINLVGRERRGRVALRDYHRICAEIAALIDDCRNPRSGDGVTVRIEYPVADDPLRAHPTQADLVVIWRGAPLAFEHPRLGLIGPAPYRRTGGHSGGQGIAYVAGPDVAPGAFGVRSAFDVVPTMLDLLGVATAEHLSGRSLLAAPAHPSDG